LSPLLMGLFAWSRDMTVFYGGIILAASGVIGILCFFLIGPLSRRFSDKVIIMGGLLILICGFVVHLPWGPGHLKLTMADLKYPNGTVISSQDSGGGGCPYEYLWCKETPALPLPQFLVGATLVCIGFPLAVVLINILYSKVIGPHPQGTYMGWFSGVESLARVLGPFYVTFVWVHAGVRWTVGCTAVFICAAMLLLLVTWKKVVPYNESYRRVSSLSITPRNV